MALLRLRRQRVVGEPVQRAALGGPLEGSVIEMGLIYTTFSTKHEMLHIPNSALLNAALRASTTANSATTPTDQSQTPSPHH